ncbi:MAG: type IIA DNA topoisomerase subunit B [Planctomycetaceae bacterium]
MSAGTKGGYTARDIEVLEGLEPVRKRPSMYIGAVDSTGLHHLLWEIVDNSVDEHLAGECDRIVVTLHKDGCSLTVSDNGRGIPVDVHPKLKRPALEIILTTLHSGGKFSNKNYAHSGGLHGVGSSVVNALSTEMTATVHRDGHEWFQRFKTGRPTGPLQKVRPFRGRGTAIFFRPDDTIFRKTTYDPAVIRERLEDMSYVHGGLTLVFNDEVRKESVEYVHPDGLLGYLAKLVGDGSKKPVTDAVFTADREDPQGKIGVVLRWTEATDEEVRSYANGIRTRGGGTHEAGLKSAIVKAVKNYLEIHNKIPKGIQLTSEDIREGLVAILSVFVPEPMFQGQTKERLNNPEITAQVDSLVRPGLENWFNSNPNLADAIIGRMVLAARARMASRDAVLEVRRKTPATRRSTLPGKLFDCLSNRPEECELFIVEGQSAGGTAVRGRDGKTQAILPLRGKILNTESLATAKALVNQELRDLLESLGTGVGERFDMRALRYHKIILLMDADSDGNHIMTLLLCFFFRHMRELIRAGHVFLAQPPLYRIAVGKEIHYALSDADKEAYLATLPANRTPEIMRFKGLGEMPHQHLAETTLNPTSRILLRVDIDAQLEADKTFDQLLGKDPALRYELIMSEANLISDEELDI